MAGFSGYLAADEVYDGPFCVLSIVDNRTFRRLIYQVLDHDPTHEDSAVDVCGYAALLRELIQTSNTEGR